MAFAAVKFISRFSGSKSFSLTAKRDCNSVSCNRSLLRQDDCSSVIYSMNGVLKIMEKTVPWNESVTIIFAF